MVMYAFISLIFIIGFVCGYILNFLINKIKKKNFYEKLILDFKKSIDEFKLQNEATSIEIKSAVQDSIKLSKILSTNQNVKGRYGEECFENIIKVCFPNNNSDYFKQFITKNVDGNKIKPDYVINLPNNKSVVVDCKLNLEKFVEYIECKNEELLPIKKKELINDINSTVTNLYNKKYHTSSDINSPDFIFMYIPIESLISLIYTDGDFIDIVKNASEKNIVIVGNSGVLTAIRLVKNIWANKIQVTNINNIIELAQNIYSLLSFHSQSLASLKNQMDNMHSSFLKEYSKFTDNSKIFKLTEQLRNYGIEPDSKKIGKKIGQLEIDKEFLQ